MENALKRPVTPQEWLLDGCWVPLCITMGKCQVDHPICLVYPYDSWLLLITVSLLLKHHSTSLPSHGGSPWWLIMIPSYHHFFAGASKFLFLARASHGLPYSRTHVCEQSARQSTGSFPIESLLSTVHLIMVLPTAVLIIAGCTKIKIHQY